MYAVIETGGKQYKVETGQEIKIPLLNDNNEKGSEVVFDKILMLNNDGKVDFGKPTLSNVIVKGKYVNSDKYKKINVLKYKKRKRYKIKNGHRQDFCTVKIEDIVVK